MTTNKIKSSNDNEINFHIHRLSRKHLNHKFFLIELSSCGNDFGYALRDLDTLQDLHNTNFYLNQTSLMHEYSNHYGKKNIEVKINENTKDLVLIIFPLQSFYKNKSTMKNGKIYEVKNSWYADYMLRYRTSEQKMDLERYRIDKEGKGIFRFLSL